MSSTSCSASDFCTADTESSSISTLEQLALALGIAGLSIILILQMDQISRRILPPDRLLAKRRQEYAYAVEQCVEYSALMNRQHVGGGKSLYSPKSDSMAWEKIAKSDDAEMKALFEEILDATKAAPVIVAIEQDTEDAADSNEYYLFLAFPPGKGVSTPEAPGLYRKVRVPLVAFCEGMAKGFEGQMTSTALCFVADASSGLGSEMLTSIVEACDNGVATISNPSWMFSLALLNSKNTHNITKDQFERIIFALCRLDAWRVRESVGANRTVLFTLPGQASVPLLLPLIQKVFVHERHVLSHDGCCHSVAMGTALRQEYGSSYRQTAAREEWKLVSATPRVISSTHPIAPLRHNRELPDALAKLNSVQASIVEAWMASVDTFLDMKAQERKNFYTPFVCRMGFLMKRSGIGNGDGSDLSGLALKNVLQYITGSRSRALPSEVMEKAVACLSECRANAEAYVEKFKLAVNSPESILIEKCVFTHKSILIGEKTLLDTVQPKEDWSLKAARKLKSCMCCVPGEGDEEDEEEEDREGGSKPKEKIDMSLPGAFATGAGRSKYVDGKAGFAFDPTKFQ
eukprot:CCRYP_007850-RA/>CCRYP_007850-RA protein AED:0.29 eAED:0.29 QI:81/1/1/1/1/1/2/3073/573